MGYHRLTGWSSKRYALALLVLAGGNAFSQASLSSPGGVTSFTGPGGTPRTGAVVLSPTDINEALTPCTFTSGAITGCKSYAGSGSDAFINLPTNTSHSFSSGDIVNNAGNLQFNNGAATVGLVTTNYSGASTTQSIVNITNTSSTSFESALSLLFPNLTAGQQGSFNVGRTATTKNSASWGFTYQSSGSNSNSYDLNFNGTGAFQRTFASGDTAFGNNAADGNYYLDVQKSGSSGTFKVKDQTATTGATRVLFDLGATDSATTNIATLNGSQAFALGAGLTLKAGSNARTGSGTLSGGTLAVANTSVTTNSRIYVQDTGGGVLANIGALYIASQTAGTGFTVTSSNALDTSTFTYWIYESN